MLFEALHMLWQEMAAGLGSATFPTYLRPCFGRKPQHMRYRLHSGVPNLNYSFLMQMHDNVTKKQRKGPGNGQKTLLHAAASQLGPDDATYFSGS